VRGEREASGAGAYHPLAGVTAGHTVLPRAESCVESKLKRSPDGMKLYFTERLEPAYSSLRVLDDRDVQVDRRDSRVDRANPALLRATLPPLPPGTHKVLWRVLSIDADVTEGGSRSGSNKGAPPRCAVGSPRVLGAPGGGVLRATGGGPARRTERATMGRDGRALGPSDRVRGDRL